MSYLSYTIGNENNILLHHPGTVEVSSEILESPVDAGDDFTFSPDTTNFLFLRSMPPSSTVNLLTN